MKRWYISPKVLIVCLLFFSVLMTGFFDVPGGEEKKPLSGPRVAILTFHSVTEEFQDNFTTISEAELAKTFQLLQENGYHFIDLEQFHGFIDGRFGLLDKSVLITFDDGYEDNYSLGYSIAKQDKVPAVIFAVTKWFTDYPRPEFHVPHMTAEQARIIASEGLWRVASHSHDGHRKVQELLGQGSYYTTRINQAGYKESEGDYKVRVWSDISMSTYTLEKLGFKPQDFAVPYGSYNSTVKEMLGKSGYKYLYTNEPGVNRAGQDPSRIMRISSAPTGERNLSLLNFFFEMP